MRILVTGGAGFIASHIVDAYINSGHRVIVMDNLSSGRSSFVNKKAIFYKVDIRDKEAVEKIINKEKPEVINHHAAQISVRISTEDPILDAEVNILGLLNLLEAGRRVKVKKVIFASSGGVVYGEATQLPTPENYHPLLPLSPYGVAKLASEYYLNFYHHIYKIPYVALRYSNVYGPRQNPHGEAGVVAIFTEKLLSKQIPTINGDGRQTRDYIYVEDVVRANEKALETKLTGSFNIGTGIETNVIDLYKRLQMITGVQIVANYGPARTGEQRRSCLAASLAKRVLHWEAKTSLTSGLQKTVDYFKNPWKKS